MAKITCGTARRRLGLGNAAVALSGTRADDGTTKVALLWKYEDLSVRWVRPRVSAGRGWVLASVTIRTIIIPTHESQNSFRNVAQPFPHALNK